MLIEANAHAIILVFSDLVVTEIPDGYAPNRLDSAGHATRYADSTTMPLSPDT